MKNGNKYKCKFFRKGQLFKRRGTTYIIVEEIPNPIQYVAIAMRVVLKNGRFNIKHKTLSWKSSFTSQYAYDKPIENIEDVYIDNRDKEIFLDFIQYVSNTEFKVSGHVYQSSYMNHTYCSVNNAHLLNINLKKYKTYSNNI